MPDPPPPGLPLPPAGERAIAASVAAEAATTAAAASTDAAALAAHGHREAATTKAAATTTSEALTAHGQRDINRLWERTQSAGALLVLATVCVLAILGRTDPTLSAIAATIVTAYYVRTNHTRVGGVGPPAQHRGE